MYEFNFYAYMLQFVTQVTSQLPLGANSYQIGVVSFGDQATYDVRLDVTYNSVEFEQIAMGINYKNQNTNTSGGK